MLLALDTSAGTSVALVDRAQGVLAERRVTDTRRHAELVGALIAEVLGEAGIGPTALDGVAAGMGPGPFTGLRVGIAAARAFALGIARPVVAIASHDAVAYAAALDGRTTPLLVVTDARRRELAWSSFAPPGADGLPVRLAGPTLIAAEALDGAPAGSGLDDRFERLDVEAIPAGALGLLAEARLAAGRPIEPVAPLYLRAPDVTLASSPKRVTG